MTKNYDNIDPDMRSEIYNIGFVAGAQHRTPSDETERRLRALEVTTSSQELFHNELRMFMGKFDGLPRAIEQIGEAIVGLKSAETQNQMVRKVVYGFIGLVLTAVCGALLGLVITST